MNSQRNTGSSTLWPKQSTTYNTRHSNAGSLSHRNNGQSYFAKPTSLATARPLNQHRSIDNRTSHLVQKKIDLSNQSLTTQNAKCGNFMYNTISEKADGGLTNMKKQSDSSCGGGTRHFSIRAFNNQSPTSSSQQDPSSGGQILRNMLVQSSSREKANQTLESSASSNNLMLDSAIAMVNQINQSMESAVPQNMSVKFSGFNELQHHFEIAQANKTIGAQTSALASVLQSFAPPQSTKSNARSIEYRKGSHDKKQTSKINLLRAGKLSFDADTKQKPFTLPRAYDVHQNFTQLDRKQSPDQSMDREVDHESNDINESVVLFKQSTQQAKSQDRTPKSGSFNSYNKEFGSIDQKKEVLEQISSLNCEKDTRNTGNLASLQGTNESSQPLIVSKLNFKTQSNSNQSSVSRKESKSHKSNEDSNKKKQKKPVQSSNLKGNSTMTINGSQGSKTPSDVFNYKLKAPMSKLEIQTKHASTTSSIHNGVVIPAVNSQRSKRTSKTNLTTKNESVKPPIGNQISRQEYPNKCRIQIQKSESQKLIKKVQENQYHQETFADDIDTVNLKFIYQTTNVEGFQTQNFVPPPNSEQIVSPEVQNIKINLKEDQPQGVAVLDFDLDNLKDQKQQIRVMARFRPLNKVESEIKDYYSAKQSDLIQFSEDSKAVKINDSYSSQSNLTFTFDYCFKPVSTQEQVFRMVGKETIDDIMEGYNGTIFAYGQTGSGKTYTMYGQDIFDEELMGIVPRAARQIFQNIKSQDLEIEYQIRIQMVEIYKEQLRDLLHDTPEAPPDLKIKEDPKRGTYVEGLNEVCIVSEEEIMSVLCTGETMRHVASTTLNQLSSRSHSICIIEIIQKFPNDSEKRGVLNLVDLAGSERVSKSHAQGQALEEAKKINFSLSMLGKVINCLTKGAPYIPYRDSKLTRLLKESLGGNNKTSLIVACSMHQSNLEETVSSLRFAQSAKFIENKVKMNIKTSPEHLQVIIEQLKQELRSCKEEIYRLRITASGSQQLTSSKDINQETQGDADVDDQSNPFIICKTQQVNFCTDSYHRCQDDRDPQRKLDFKQTIHNRPHQSLLAKNYDVIETNNQRMQMLSLLSEFSSIPGTGTPNFISPVKNYELKLMQVIHRNEDLEMKLKSKDKDLEAVRSQKDELSDKVNHLEERIVSYKQKMLVMEKRVAEVENEKDVMIVNQAKQSHKLEDYQTQIETLNQQVKCLEKGLEESEVKCQKLLKEKSTMYQKQIKDFLNETIKLKRIKVSDALDAFINKPSQLKKSFMSQLDLLNNYTQQERMIIEAEDIIQPLNEKELLSRNIYSMEIINALEDTPPELTIYLLKQMLIEASLANHNLQRTLAVNRWRQVLEFGKHKIKSNLCKVQENTIDTLEQVLERTRKTHDKLRARVDKLETHLFENKNQYPDLVIMTDGNLQTQGPNTMKNIILKERTNLIQPNQSLTSMALNTATQPGNQKSRFVRTITNKTLGKVFNFMEKSPLSRGSIGPNQSILSHYYGQKHNPNYKMGETPMRTDGMNSPVIYNFQSPVRRQNTFIYTNKPQQPQIVLNGANAQIEGCVTMPNKVLDEGYPALLNNDQMTFEDAIVKFFNSSEIEDKSVPRTVKNMIPLTEKKKDCQFSNEDLLRIESCETLQEVKDYIRNKFDRQSIQDPLQNSASVHHNPMLLHYQNNAQFSSNSNLINSQIENNPQINSHTTNNNLYAQSKDYNEGQGISSQKGVPCSSSGRFHDNQRQEHVLTLASEYMITSNSVIGLNGLLSGNGNLVGNHFYQNDYLDRLQEKIVQLQEEAETQKCRAEEHKKAYYESKRQIEQMREMLEDKESKHNLILKSEISQWEHALNKFKEMSDNELLKKQKEISKLHEILAQWMENYQELELSKGVRQNGIDKLTMQTLKHQRNQSGLLCEIMKTPYYKRLSNNFGSLQSFDSRSNNQLQPITNIQRVYTDQTLSGHMFQTHTSQGSNYGAIHIKHGQKETDRKKLDGDNSPVPQEDSCLDLENSVYQNNLQTHPEESRIEAMTLQTYQSNE